MMFLTMEDEFGVFEATVFPNAFAAIGTLDRYGPYVVTGKVDRQYGSVTVTADRVEPQRAKVA